MKYGLMFALVLLIPQIRAQVVEEERNASALFGGGAVGESHPNVDLPKQVIAPEGKLTLYADYEHAGDDGIPLYLVNRSEKWLSFGVQGGDLCLKLEVQNPDGEWQRAQVHLSSWCGNSFGFRPLPAGHHFSLLGYQPHHGIEAKVRYACFGQVEVISNVGKGSYLPDDVTAAMKDGIGMRGFPRVLSSYVTFSSEEAPSPREDDSFRQEIAVASLELMRVLGGSFGHEKKAEAWLAGLRAKPTPNPNELAQMQAIQAILSRSWSPEMDQEKLVNYCVQALSQEPPKSPGFGDPSSLTFLLWEVLGNFSEQNLSGYASPKPISMDCWRPILKLAAQKVMSATGVEQDAMGQVLAQVQLADECLPDAAFEPLLESGNQELVKLAAHALSRRTRWGRLVELGWKLLPESQISVLGALACPVAGVRTGLPYSLGQGSGHREPESRRDEVRFWEHCMSTHPQRCARELSALSSSCYYSVRLPYIHYLRQQLLSYLTAEADQDEKRPEEYKIESQNDYSEDVLKLLVPQDGIFSNQRADKEERAAVVALLHRLLAHHGYRVSRGSRFSSNGPPVDFEKHSFSYREEARDALRRLNENVPEGVVFEREVTSAPRASK